MDAQLSWIREKVALVRRIFRQIFEYFKPALCKSMFTLACSNSVCVGVLPPTTVDVPVDGSELLGP